jgi:hypothetical protein
LPEITFSSGSPCPMFTGSGCIGLNVTLANSNGVLTTVVEHEIDEVLGLGSALHGLQLPRTPGPRTFFAGPAPESGVLLRTPPPHTLAPAPRRPSSQSTVASIRICYRRR